MGGNILQSIKYLMDCFSLGVLKISLYAVGIELECGRSFTTIILEILTN